MKRVVLNTSYCIVFAVLLFFKPLNQFWSIQNPVVSESTQELIPSISADPGTSVLKDFDNSLLKLLDTNITESICEGDSLFFNDAFIKEEGEYKDTLLDINNMDSIITLNLIVNDTFFTEEMLQVCMGDTIFINDTLQFFSDTSKVAIFPSVNGCDSTVVYTVTQRPESGKITTVEIETCLGDSALYEGQYYKQDTILRIFQTAEGCDSVINLKIIPLDTFRVEISETICAGDTIMLGSQEFTTDTVYTEVLQSIEGCDSTVVYTLDVLDTFYTQIDTMFCSGETLTIDEHVITTDTVIILDTLQAVNGCDSIIALRAVEVEQLVTNLDERLCLGDSLEYMGVFFKADTMVADTFSSIMGCDSIVNFNLNVLDTFVNQIDTTICAGESIVVGDSIYTESTMITNQVFTPNACITLNVMLTVGDTFNIRLDSVACEGDTVFLGDRPLLSSGLYTETLQTINGCDSIVSIDLTVLDTVLVGMDSTICMGDTVFFGMDTLTMSGVYDQSFPRANGCDSTIRLNLNVLDAPLIRIDTAICSGDTLFIDTLELDSTGVYTRVFPAANGCDSTIIIDLEVLDTFFTQIDTALCLGDTLDLADMMISSGGTFMQTYQSVGGCDSVVMVNVIQNDTFLVNLDIGLCQGDTLFLADTAVTMPGIYTEFLSTTAGCDSTVQYNVSLLDTVSVMMDSTICEGDTVFVGMDTLLTSGMYRSILSASNGCDSIVNLNLTVLDSFYREDIFTICQGDTLMYKGEMYTEAGVFTEVFTAANGCDSTETLIVNVAPLANVILDTTICGTDTVFLGNRPLTTSGTFTERLQTVSGCDSLVTINLTVLPAYDISIDTMICRGDVLFLGDQALSSTGFYSRTLETVDGCDSLVAINLSVIDTFLIKTEAAICEGDTFRLGDQELTESGVYSQILRAATGCDSILEVSLTVYDNFEINLEETICQGDSFLLGDRTLRESGQYTAMLQTVNGCDSMVTVNLNVAPTYNDTIPINLCDNETYVFGGEFITNAGLYTNTFTSRDGCDSTVTIDVSVLPIFSRQVDTTICEGEVFTFGTRELSRAGEYTETFTSQNGCDSVVFLTLNFRPRANSSISATICEGEVYEFGERQLSEAGVYQEAFPASNGCDSIVTLNLRVNPTSRSFIQQTICQGETYVFGDRQLGETGIYRDTFLAQNGCFIVLELNLEVLPSIRDTIRATICEGASYSFGDQNLTQSGMYTQNLNSSSGCDSTLVLDLRVTPNYETEQDVTICPGDTFQLGRLNLTRTGTYIAFLESSFGCDSTVIINLNVQEDMQEVIEVTLCEGESYQFGSETLTEPGTYMETFTSSGGCDSTVTVELSFERLDPMVTINQEGEIVVEGLDGATFELLDCDADTVISTSDSPFFMPMVDGNYAIIVTTEACRDTTPCLNYVVSSAEEILPTERFKLFPNPTNERITIEVEGDLTGRYDMQILDMRGKQYVRKTVQLLPKSEVEVSQLPAGLYLINLVNQDYGMVRLRFLKIE
jgi:hypothetical protein